MMSNPSQYYGMANGYPPAANGPQQHQQHPHYPPSSQQQQQVLPPQQPQYPVKNVLMNGPSQQPPVQQYGPPPPVATVAPLQNGPPMAAAQKQPFNAQLPPQQLQQNNRVANLVSNGNSATSSRTSSPALVNSSIPASQLPPTMGVRPAGIYPVAAAPPSSQSQTLGSVPPTIAGGNYNLSPNNNSNTNWTSGINTNLVNTPPRTASGLSTPLNASTPTLAQQQHQQPPVNGPVSNLTASMQNLNVNRPPSVVQQQTNHLNGGSGTPQPPVSTGSSYPNHQLPPTMQKPPVTGYGQQVGAPLINQQGRPINGNYAPTPQRLQFRSLLGIRLHWRAYWKR